MNLIPQGITQKVTRTVGRQILKTKMNSPHIFFVAGVVGIVGSAVLACRATLKLEKTVDEIKNDVLDVKMVASESRATNEDYNEQEYYKDLGYVYIKSAGKIVKLYGPSVIIGSISVASLTGSHVQLTRRNAALTATLTLVTKAFDDYRARVQDQIGKERELDIYHGISEQKIEIDGKKELVKVHDPKALSAYSVVFDASNRNWQKDMELNRIFIECQQNYANHLLRARGHVFLNEVYDQLGFDHTQAGQLVGWVSDGTEGDGYVDFGLYDMSNVHFINGQPRGVILDFNVDGIVYNKIQERNQ